MKRPRIKTIKKKPETTYIILPEYLKEKADLKRALKAASDHKRLIDYCVEQGGKDSGFTTGLYKLLVENCLDTIAKREHPKVLNGSPFLKENGYRVYSLDDLFN